MSDLAANLRESADEVQSFPHPSDCDHLHVAFKVMRDAADEIERLRAALAQQAPAPADEREAWQPRWMPCELTTDDEGNSACKTCGHVRHSACAMGGRPVKNPAAPSPPPVRQPLTLTDAEIQTIALEHRLTGSLATRFARAILAAANAKGTT